MKLRITSTGGVSQEFTTADLSVRLMNAFIDDFYDKSHMVGSMKMILADGTRVVFNRGNIFSMATIKEA